MADMSPRNRFQPDTVFPPGDTLQETLDAIGMNQAELSHRMGRPRKTINGIIKGEVSITPETAIQLERVLGVPSSFWSRLEGIYQDHLAMIKEQRSLNTQLDWLKEIPVRAMVKEGWIREFKNKTEQLRELLGFFGVASPDQWRQIWEHDTRIAYRRAEKKEIDFGAVSGWLRKGQIEARNIQCAPYNPEELRKALNSIRSLTNEPPKAFQPELKSLCATAGVAVMLVKQLPRTRASGAAYWLTPRKAAIQLSLRYKKNDQFWFSFFHEAAHLLLHHKKRTYVDDGTDSEGIEDQANRSAARVLIPDAGFTEYLNSTARISKRSIRLFASQIGVAPGIVVGRLQHDGHLDYRFCNDLKVTLVWKKTS